MRRALIGLVVWVLCAPALHAAAQDPGVAETRVVIGYGVLCRAQPDRTSAVVLRFQLGESFMVRDRVTEGPGDVAWYEHDLGARGSCWVFGPLTIPSSSVPTPDAQLLALAEHALGLGADATFEHLVALENFLIQRERRLSPFFLTPADVPPMLALRHLQIVDRAARAVGDFRWAAEEPLKRSWVLARPGTVRFFEPGGLYYVPASHYWDLYERYKSSSDAEAIAWAAAESPVYTDECYTECLLSILGETYLPYWRAFPRGGRVAEAIAIAEERTEYAAGFCALVSAGHLTIQHEWADRLIREFRESLEPVAADKAGLLAHLARIEEICLAGTAGDLTDPRAIPGLADALGLGFSIVRHTLAAFGEEAVAPVIDVADSAGARGSAVEDALITLRWMIESMDARPLSPDAVEQIRRTASQWLDRRDRQSIGTLGAAVDLAAALDDPVLMRIVESLATDPNAVVARGVDPSAVAFVQRRAADRLAGIPARPRP